MTFNRQNNPNKKVAANADPLLTLADLLMKIDQREKIVPIPDTNKGESKL